MCQVFDSAGMGDRDFAVNNHVLMALVQRGELCVFASRFRRLQQAYNTVHGVENGF